MSKKIKIFLLGCALMVMCCMGITAGASDNAKVIAHNLTITDEGISVNFYVDIDVEAQNDIKVTLNGSQVEIPAEPTKIIIDAKAYSCYKFTQPVVAKEMDDKVSLSIVAGEEELVTDSYSVNDYVAEVQAGGYGYNFENLANAMTYYGEFAEVYLKYNNATSASEKALASIDGFNEDVLDAYAMTKGSEYPEGLTYYGTQLNLNSEITLRMCFQLADGKTAADYGNITAVSIDGTKDLGVLKKGSYKDTQYYYVDIANIGADVLGKSYEIKAGDKTLLSNCSVLSYANAVVNKYGSDAAKADLANLSKALYLYSEKANLYIESKLVAVYDIFYSSEGFSATPDEFTQVYLTSNGDVTTESTGNTPVTILSQLNDSRTKGCSVWMQTAYTVADAEETFTGPYVIRRYTDNINVLNITGTATLEATVDGSLGEFAAQYPGGIAKVEISQADNGEVYVSGTLTVKGSAKSGLITTSTADITITADGLTEDAEIIFPAYNTQMLTGTGEASAIKLVDSGAGHFGAIETTKVTEDALPNLALGSIICVCGDNVSEDLEHSCAWTEAQEDGLHAAYAIEWTATTSLPNTSGSYYLTQNLEGLTARTDKNNTNIVNLDLNGKTVSGSGSSGNLYRVRKGTLNIADSQGDGAITMTGGTNTAGAVYVNGTAAYLNIFGGSISANAGTSVTINTGCINMYGGTIIGSSKETEIVVSSTDTSLNFIGANAVQVGLVAAATNSAELNIKGGTIKGEVLIGTNEASSVTISDKAIVGIADESDTDKAYGIGVSSLVTAAQIISCDDVTSAKESIVLKNLEDVTISGTGIASAFEFIKDGAGHFGVYETASATEGTLPTLNVGSVICGCGDNISQDPNHSCAWTTAQGGVEAAYALEWTATTSLPTSAGSYYLTQNMEGVATRSQLATVDAVINFDLAGYTIEGSGIDGMLYRVQAGTFNIADSSEQKIGAIKSTGATNTYGSIAVWGNTSESSYINIFGGTYSAETGTAVAIRRGYINMYGGTILPGEKPEEYAYANAVQVGIGNNGLTNLNVSGGTIKGEVLIYDTSGVTLTVTGDAQVGIKESEQSEKPYGIGTADTVTSAQAIHFSNTSGNVVLKDTKYLALAEGATGDASKFTIIDKHNQVVNVDESETLGYAAYMCVCGKTDGRYDHTDDCEQPAYAWEPWTSTTGLPTDNGSFYLTQNLTGLTTRSNIGSGNDINLDLAGYTVEGTGNGGVLYRIQRGSLNLADSSEEQKGAIRATGESDKFGRALYVWGNEGSEWNANIFGGTLSAEKGVPVTISRGNIHMYGGKILAGTSVEYSGFMLANSVQVGLSTGASANLKVAGGIITGEVLIGNETSSTVAVSDDAQVGIEAGNDESGNVIPYGIGIVSAVTSTQTINCDGITADASVVIQNLDKVGVIGTGEASVFTLLEASRNTIIDDNVEGIGALGYEAYMCVCGAKDGKYDHTDDCIKPAYAWEPWTSTTELPTENGSFYLTQNLTGLTTRSTIGSGYIVNLDLAGKTVDGTGQGGILYRIQRGGLNLADSSEEQTGKIYATGESTGVGRALYVWGNQGKVWYANIFGGTLTADTSVPVAISNGNLHMYGGTIEAGTSVEYSGTTLANSVQIGLVDGTTPILNVESGTITGEVLLGNNNAELKISDNAKVAIADDDADKAYGIGTTSLVTSAKTVECDNVSADASVVIKNSHDVTVSGTGEGSAFSIIDQHNKVVDDNTEGIGNLSFAPQMCVCGAVGEHTQVGNCAVPTSAWLPWNATISKASSYAQVQLPTTSMSYYLTEDMSGDNAIVAQTSLTTQRLSIDLAGHTVDASDTAKRIFAMNDGSSATLNITDSVGGGVLKNAQQEKIDVYDGKVIRVYSADATVNLYAGILTAEGTNIAGEEDNNACTVSIAYSDTFNMYGGTVVDNGGEGEDVFKAFNNHSKYNYVDGIVIEDGLYKRGDTANTFRAGYGKTNINPENGVSLGSYSNEDVRKSTGILSDLEAVAIAVTDAENNTLILVVTDLSWGRISDANAIRKAVSKKYGIPKENVLVGGTHNHSAPSAKWTSDENIAYMLQWQENVMAAIDIAIRDRAEATMEVGTTQTVDLVFSRRYLCEDGKYQGGGSSEYDETTAAVKEHESEADEEIQMLRFVREDAKDILIAQWQSHACNISWDRTEGSDHYKASGEWPQIIRSTLEEELGVHCMYMQGAAGNLASMSDIAGENLSNATSDSEAGTIGYNDYVAIGEAVASYVSTAYKATNVFTEVESGLIQINQYKMPVTMRATDTEAEREATEEEMPELNTVAIGNVSLVTLPSELFDTSAQYVKNNTPFAMTLIMGYTCGGSGYEAPDEFWDNGCYEVVHGNYVRGTAELMMQHYVNKLTEFYATK